MTIRTRARWVNRVLMQLHFKVGICTSADDFNHELGRLGVPLSERPEWLGKSSHAETHVLNGVGESKDEQVILICIKPKDKAYESHLTHEAVHVWQFEREFIGESEPSSEFEAYCINAIADNIKIAYKGK